MNKLKCKFFCKLALILLFLSTSVWSIYQSISISEYFDSQYYKFSFETNPNSVKYDFLEFYYDFTELSGTLIFFIDSNKFNEYRIIFPSYNISEENIETELFQCKDYFSNDCELIKINEKLRFSYNNNYLSIEPSNNEIKKFTKIVIHYNIEMKPSGNFVIDNRDGALQPGSKNKFIFSLGRNINVWKIVSRLSMLMES